MASTKPLCIRFAAALAAGLVAITTAGCSDEPQPVSFEELFADKTIPGITGPAAPRSTFAPSGDSSACAAADTATVDVPAFATGEPGVRVPQPPGWTRFTQMDSEIIRLALTNPSMIANKFAPNIVITVEPSPSQDAATVYTQAQHNLINLAGALDMAVAPVTVCGLPAERITFRSPGMGPQSAERHLQAIQVLARGDSGQAYLISVTVQTTDPNNADYQRDAARMLDGVQVFAPTASH
ncbi:hypothetical protein MMAG44476_35586 [Mycolicibacterium mageritense DSM 44476 = CIP 104973]|jgi:hypothetical protein|uniref:Lipoprotein LpqN n=2 Tax=Mycolicibacterium TaxID=1866885 RepID=A0A100W7W6_MYCCR|nr:MULTISPECIES: LpqN/LpqT family lipoprotein [Mycolicibacterium]MCC9186107.1 LpqN/LpqT family lipoprotein [Mycolicibacterium mageritense]MCV7207081.1 LpqN/LpqT family lipoprotein [Mycolicibacterium canariasense]ORV10088.1 hypothetical protein AWB94_08295 [Mycolicibacterium canariasense]GAS93174.1 uncharacterized protein RMCC_0140 [Mycolicibacterium canariasense]